MKIASLDIDAQNAFSPSCPDELPIIDAHLIVDELNAQARLAHYRVMSKDAHPANAIWCNDDKNATPAPYPHADRYWRAHAVVGTDGFELMAGLPKAHEYDFLVYKGVERHLHPYGACYHDLDEKISTGLIEWLTYKNVKIVIIGGLALDFCVYHSARQLLKAEFDVWVNMAAVRGICADDCQDTINELTKNGARFFNDSVAIKNAINPIALI